DDAFDRLRADHLLGIHRHEIAIEHRGWADEDFSQRDGGKLERDPTGLEHASFDRGGHLSQMRVAVVELAPGVADTDGGLRQILVGQAHALGKRTPHEGAEVGIAVPRELAAAGNIVWACHGGRVPRGAGSWVRRLAYEDGGS